MPDLVRRELADARQGEHAPDRRAGRCRVSAGAREPLEQQPVLAHAQRAQADVTLELLAGARIDHTSAVRPAARRAVHPLDDVVAHVQRVGALGQELDPEGVVETGRLERLQPTSRRPRAARCGSARAPRDRRSRRSASRTGEVRGGRGRIESLQTMTDDPAPLDRARERRGVVLERDREGAHPRVELARRVARIGQAHQRLMLHEGERARFDGDAPYFVARLRTGEGDQRLELEIVGEGEASVDVDGALLAVEAKLPARSPPGARRPRARRAAGNGPRSISRPPSASRATTSALQITEFANDSSTARVFRRRIAQRPEAQIDELEQDLAAELAEAQDLRFSRPARGRARPDSSPARRRCPRSRCTPRSSAAGPRPAASRTITLPSSAST